MLSWANPLLAVIYDAPGFIWPGIGIGWLVSNLNWLCIKPLCVSFSFGAPQGVGRGALRLRVKGTGPINEQIKKEGRIGVGRAGAAGACGLLRIKADGECGAAGGPQGQRTDMEFCGWPLFRS